MDQLSVSNLEQIIDKITELGTVFGVKLLAAIVVFVLGRWLGIQTTSPQRDVHVYGSEAEKSFAAGVS